MYDVDQPTPSIARVYDYALGGRENSAVDRAMFEKISAGFPEYRPWAVANREFLVRVVQFMAESGIDQFLDLGSGLPTSPSVYEVAQAIRPDVRVVYVDHDPVVSAYGRAHYHQHPNIGVAAADVRDPQTVIQQAEVQRLIDFSQPIGVLLIAVLLFVDHEASRSMMRAYRAALPVDSMIAVSLVYRDPAAIQQEQAYNPEYADEVSRQIALSLTIRTRTEVDELFEGLDLVEPGLVPVTAWRGDPDATMTGSISGVARLV
jgi:S-adenosyl methyltransferase